MFLFLAVVLFGSAIVLLSMALTKTHAPSGLERSIATLENMSLNPADLKEELELPFADRVLEPLQERALNLGRRLTGADKAERIRHKLDLAGNPRDMSVDRIVSLKVMAAVVLGFCGIAYAALISAGPLVYLGLGALGVGVGFMAPDMYLYQKAYERAEEIRRTLADAVDLLTISVEAGLGFDAALQQVARNTGGPLAEEFSRVLREMQLGKGRADSLRALSERTNVDDLQTFVGAMVQADSFGISIAQVLRVQSGEMRIKRRQHAEKRAQQVPVKIMVPLILCVLPCLMTVVLGPAIISVVKQFT
ncbi:type II secretion system F family protein [Nocardioides humilatus]|uniref:Type II secretion system F family protein n=1 Tax=Nocardioides humilatus TaxID=2607660 RepID=A0A5B1LDW1_9ACTN|nr:type II secretion system F family protein [Nocardioides humilatus]KAA1417970.1 type II secretion system F family protein [Nocardioides humilatus]